MLATKRSAGVAPDVNLTILLHTGKEAHNEGIHSGFEIQSRCHEKSKTGVSVATQKGLAGCPRTFFKIFKGLALLFLFFI